MFRRRATIIWLLNQGFDTAWSHPDRVTVTDMLK